MLVDTSVWIDFFNGHESGQVQCLACAIAESESIAVPGVVLTEILLGLKHDAEADHIEAARIYRLCRAKGFTIRSTIDCLIAQLCLRDGLALLTKDRDFKAIADCLPL